MRKILITGAGSYIGTSFAAYAGAHYPDWQVDTLDLLDENWRERSFAGFDSVFHVAGIAHEKETKENEPLYYKVNRDLAVEVCERAKREGAGQFVFLSSMSVYGVDHGRITKETPPAPVTHYGRSKLQAEQGIAPLEDENFKVCVLRPPMVYGKGCRGNFSSMLRLVRKLPIFPRAKNERSMLHIDNLCCFLCKRMEEGCGGLFFPQNEEYMNPSQMAVWIGEAPNAPAADRMKTANNECMRIMYLLRSIDFPFYLSARSRALALTPSSRSDRMPLFAISRDSKTGSVSISATIRAKDTPTGKCSVLKHSRQQTLIGSPRT